jgi:hypothetical protein
VRSAQPFRVTDLKARKGDVAAASPADASKPIHTLNVTIKAPSRPGPLQRGAGDRHRPEG